MNEPTGDRSREELNQELLDLESRAAALRNQLGSEPENREWWPEFYTAYHVVIGGLLGLAAAGASLLFNVIGSVMVGQHPLQLIRVLLTFPLGEKALTAQDEGFALSAGCFLYLATGMAFGALLHLILMRFLPRSGMVVRLMAAVLLGILLWLVNFYAILSWLQPLLFGGKWLLSEIPYWVAAATHVVFAVTLAIMGRFGKFEAPVPARAAS